MRQDDYTIKMEFGGGNYGYVFIGKAHVTDADAEFLMLG